MAEWISVSSEDRCDRLSRMLERCRQELADAQRRNEILDVSCQALWEELGHERTKNRILAQQLERTLYK